MAAEELAALYAGGGAVVAVVVRARARPLQMSRRMRELPFARTIRHAPVRRRCMARACAEPALAPLLACCRRCWWPAFYTSAGVSRSSAWRRPRCLAPPIYYITQNNTAHTIANL